MKKTIPLCAVVALLIAPFAQAQDDELEFRPYYIGVDYTFGFVTGFSTQADPDIIEGNPSAADPQDTSTTNRARFYPEGARVRAGRRFNQFFAIEGSYGRGNSDSNDDRSVELNSYYGLHVRLSAPVEIAGFYVGGLIGVGGVSIDTDSNTEADGGEDNFSEAGVSYGINFGYKFGNRFRLNADWVLYVDTEDTRFHAANVGLEFGFGGGGGGGGGDDDDDF